MTKNIVNILIFTAISAVIVLGILAIMLVLDTTSTEEVHQTLIKSLLVICIIAFSSIVTLFIIKFGTKR